jgi:hypothetical protein
MSICEEVQRRNAFTACSTFRIESLEASLDRAREIALRDELDAVGHCLEEAQNYLTQIRVLHQGALEKSSPKRRANKACSLGPCEDTPPGSQPGGFTVSCFSNAPTSPRVSPVDQRGGRLFPERHPPARARVISSKRFRTRMPARAPPPRNAGRFHFGRRATCSDAAQHRKLREPP